MAIEQLVQEFSARNPDAAASVEIHPSRILLSLSGSWDLQLSKEIGEFLKDFIDESGRGTTLAIDLSRVGYISSTGVGAMMLALSQARTREVRLVVRNMGHNVRSVFELLGFAGFFELEEDGP